MDASRDELLAGTGLARSRARSTLRGRFAATRSRTCSIASVSPTIPVIARSRLRSTSPTLATTTMSSTAGVPPAKSFLVLRVVVPRALALLSVDEASTRRRVSPASSRACCASGDSPPPFGPARRVRIRRTASSVLGAPLVGRDEIDVVAGAGLKPVRRSAPATGELDAWKRVRAPRSRPGLRTHRGPSVLASCSRATACSTKSEPEHRGRPRRPRGYPEDSRSTSSRPRTPRRCPSKEPRRASRQGLGASRISSGDSRRRPDRATAGRGLRRHVTRGEAGATRRDDRSPTSSSSAPRGETATGDLRSVFVGDRRHAPRPRSARSHRTTRRYDGRPAECRSRSPSR